MLLWPSSVATTSSSCAAEISQPVNWQSAQAPVASLLCSCCSPKRHARDSDFPEAAGTHDHGPLQTSGGSCVLRMSPIHPHTPSRRQRIDDVLCDRLCHGQAASSACHVTA